MIIECEQCGTKYKFDESKISADGTKVRCSKCQHVFSVFHPFSKEEKDIFAEEEERPDGPSMQEWEDEFTVEPPPERIETTSQIQEEKPPPETFVPSPQEKKVFTEQGAAMEEEISLEEYKQAYREIRAEEGKRGFIIHLVVYALINAMLIVINLLYSPQKIWFFYPLIGWGIGIVIHYLNAIRWIEKVLRQKEAKAEYRAKEKRERSPFAD